jgi:signal transduction histidine kinase/PAS domain-containing protein
VPVDTDAEAVRLRAMLRDLVALSAIPAVWTGREPLGVASGLADELVDLLQLDFAFVRLCDPDGAGAAEVTRGDAWRGFPKWLESHPSTTVQFPPKEIVPDVGGGSAPCRGIAIPIGVNGERGVVAAASERGDFPTATDQLLLSLAANQAATAFQSSRLVEERKRAEEELREARDDLEMKVTERTADLRRSEAYLTEAQRLTHTGSFAIDASTRQVTHSSEEHSRLYGLDPEQGTPSLSEFLERIDPQDREMCVRALERGIREATDIEVEYRVVLPHSPVRRHRAIAHPVFDAAGELDEVVGTIVDVTERRQAESELERLAREQAALRRVATLVAEESPPAEVFATVAEELANVLGDVECSLFRDEGNGTASVVALLGARVSAGMPVGARLPVDGAGVVASVLREGRPCRIGDYSAVTGTIAQRGRELGIRSAVGCPILVGGRVWGVMAAGRFEADAFPPETETQVAQFAELVATAIANAEARAEVGRLAEEQAALRRIATLVAEGASPSAVLDAVVGEMESLLEADRVSLNRFEHGAEILVLAHRRLEASRLPVGSRVSTEGDSVTATVRRTGRPARMESYEGADGALAELARATGLRSSVAAPIVVDGRLWGLITASWKGERSPPADTEERMARFAELLDTAIVNADSRDQLTASRARLLTAGDEARRRVVRDLHDGAQQRMVHTIMLLKLAQRALHTKDDEAESLVREALEQAEQGTAELRELVLGILPSVLTHGGLRAGVRTLVARLDLPVRFDVTTERFPEEIEASAYFIVAEALTNVVKHSRAARAEVRASVADGLLRVEIRDDGIGGADPEGHGLVGLGDRVTALGGRLEIESPAGAGTRVAATLPISSR